MSTMLVGTRSGVYRAERTTISPLGLETSRVSAIYAWWHGSTTRRILAGTYEDGLFISDDQGASWHRVEHGMTAPCIRWLGDDPLNPGALLVGTEPGRIFRSHDHGDTWNELSGIRDIPGHEDWFLPYSPRAGAVRNVFVPTDSTRYFASVEVGGLLESTDNGETWSCRHVTVDTDIHYVTGHPRDRSTIWAALGYAGIERSSEVDGARTRGGLARSTDGGQTWTKLFGDYTRAVIVPTTRPDVVLAGPAPHVGREGRIEISLDNGETWLDASTGIDTPMPDMVETFVEAPDGAIWAICSHGRLFRTQFEPIHWVNVLGHESSLRCESISFASE